MFELFVASDAAQRKIAESLEPQRQPSARKPERERPRRDVVRSTSAAALRSLAERLEPSPSR
jgi:hypothetical protein